MSPTDNPRIKLARAFGQRSKGEIAEIAARAGVTARQVGNLLSGRPLSVNAFLRLCIAGYHDPAPDLPGPVDRLLPDDLNSERFAMALKMGRAMRLHGEQDAADEMGVSKTTVSRVENCKPVSLGVFMKACRYLNSHPFGWMRNRRAPNVDKPVVSRETSNKQTNASAPVGAAA